MKVLMISSNSEGKGTFWRTLWFARYLVKFGNEVLIICLNSENKFVFTSKIIDNVKIILLPRLAHQDFAELPAHLFRAVWITVYEIFHKFDVVHFFNVPSLTSGLPAIPLWLFKKLGLKKCKLIIDWDDLWGKGGLVALNNQGWLAINVADFLEKHIPLLADKVTIVSDEIEKHALLAGINKNKIFKIINGADVKNIHPINKNFSRKKVGLNLKSKIICFPANIKICLPYVIACFDKVCDKLKSCQLILLNPISDYVKKCVNGSRFKDKILIIGFKPYQDYLFYLGSSDVILMPRSNHVLDKCQFPSRLGDIMASARPLVTNYTGDAWKIVEESNCGLIAKVGDERDFSNKIIYLLSNPKIASKLGKNGRIAAEKEYSWEKQTRSLFKEVYGA